MKNDRHILRVLKQVRNRRNFERIVAILSVIVLFITVNSLKLDADTLERIPTCGIAEHAHTDVCFAADGSLLCGLVEHTHSDACYQQRPKGSTDGLEQAVEEIQTVELSEVEHPAMGVSAADDAPIVPEGIEAPAEELDAFVLDDEYVVLGGEDEPLDGDASDIIEAEAVEVEFVLSEAEPEKPEALTGYIVGSQYPFYLSDVIRAQGLALSIDDVVEIGQAIENDDDPILFTYENVDGDIALYVDQDFERAELLISAAGELHVVELLFGIAPVKSAPAATENEETVPEDETVEVTEVPGEVTDEEATDGETADAAEAKAEDSERHPLKAFTHYAADVDLADVVAYPISLNDLMARAERVDAVELEPADEAEKVFEVEEVLEDGEPAVIEAPVEEVAYSLMDAETPYIIEETLSVEDDAVEIIESEPIEPMLSEVTVELGAETAEPEATEATDGWIIDYDAALLSIAKGEDGYALTVVGGFEETLVTVNNGDIYTLTLRNGTVMPSLPAARFTASTESMVVNVEAPEGAFPEGTKMVVTDVDDADTLSNIAGVVEQDFVRVERVHAVDITFLNADGAEIEPLIPISVTMSAREQEAEKETVVVHVNHDGEAEVVGETTQVVSEPNETIESEGETASMAYAFTADAFSVYALVVGEKLETRVMAADGNTYRIEVTYTEDAEIPADARLDVAELTDETYLSRVRSELLGDRSVVMGRFFDIKIMNGEDEIQPAAPVMVRAELVSDEATDLTDATPCAVHFAEDAVEVVKAAEVDAAVSFRAESFSVWGVIYTVDFEIELDGTAYAFAIPGGGGVTLGQIAEALGLAGADETETEATEDVDPDAIEDYIAEADVSELGAEDGEQLSDATEDAAPVDISAIEVSERTRQFLNGVADVRFSDDSLIWVGKIAEAASVGEIREANALPVQYSAELTEEQIAELNARTVEAGDWALISLKPFETEETLTVLMADGTAYAMRVTDAQISTNVLTADGVTFKITVTFDEAAEIPDGTKLEARELDCNSDEYIQYLGRTWSEVNREYLERIEQIRQGGLDELDSLRPVNIDQARFFDIVLVYNDEPVEPKAPVQVDIQLVDGLMNSATEPIIGVVHFPRTEDPEVDGAIAEQVELIETVETEIDERGGVAEFVYAQGSFSVSGVYIGQPTQDAGMESGDPSKTLPKLSALRAGEPMPELDPLQASKVLEPNTVGDSSQEDGTYTLSLSVKGDEKEWQQITKANVLIVMDRSTSMRNGNANEGTAEPLVGQPQSGVTYYGLEGGRLWPLIYNNGTWTIHPTGQDTFTYTGTVYQSSNRLQAEQAALDELVGALTSKNVTDTSDPEYEARKDVIEVMLVSFGSQRGSELTGKKVAGSNPEEFWQAGTETGWETSYATGGTLYNAVHNNSVNNGTNWQDALVYAKGLADLKKQAEPKEDVFIIFLTDGEPTAIYGEKPNNDGYGAHHYENSYGPVGDGSIYALRPAMYDDRNNPTISDLGKAWDVRDIVNDGHKFFAIFTFNTSKMYAQYLQYLINYAYGMEVRGLDPTTTKDTPTTDAFFTSAETIGELRNSFDDIFTRIFDTLSNGDVEMVDGLTTDAMTTILEDGKADGLSYRVTKDNGDVVYTVTATGPKTNPTEVVFKITGIDREYKLSTDEVKVKTTEPRQRPKLDENGEPVLDGGQQVMETYTGTYYSLTVGGIEYRMALAEIQTTGSGDNKKRTLRWDLSSIGSLKKGYTYTVDFTVWPNQDAFDYVAGLNNRLDGFTWDQSIATPVEDAEHNVKYTMGGVAQYPSIVKYPNGVFSVLTNTEQYVTYSTVHSHAAGDVMEIEIDPDKDELVQPEPMDLAGTDISVTKEWNDTLDPGPLKRLIEDAGDDAYGNPNFHITLDVNRYTLDPQGGAGTWTKYTSLTFHPIRVAQDTYIWPSKTLNIAPGIMVTTHPGGSADYPTAVMDGKTYYILETGHDYKLEESGFDSYNFEFYAEPYHPMMVDGEMMNIELTPMTGSGATHDYEAVQKTVDQDAGQSTTFAFTGSNNLRSGLNIVKKLQHKSGADILVDPNRTFYVKVEAKDKDGNVLTYSPPAQGMMTSDEYAQALKRYDDAYPIWYKWFSGYTVSASGDYHGVTTDGVQGDGWSYSWPSGAVKEIKAGELLQLINIPNGTQIRVVEVKPVYDNSEPPQFLRYDELEPGDVSYEVEPFRFKLHSVTGDLTEHMDAEGYGTIGFDNSYEIVFTNRSTRRLGNLNVEKKWLKADGTEYTPEELTALGANSTTIRGNLVQINNRTHVETSWDFTLSSANAWKQEWQILVLQEADDDEYTYELRNVTETPPRPEFDFDATTPTIIDDGQGNEVYVLENVQKTYTDLRVRKVWSDGNDSHSSDTVSYKIQRAEYDVNGTEKEAPVDYNEVSTTPLRASNSWQYTYPNLPQTNGRPETDTENYRRYVYSVVETNVPTGYRVEYGQITENGQTINVIRNIPNDEKLSITKNWVDGAGDPLTADIIPEGAYITGDIKRDYTVVEWKVTIEGTATEYNGGGYNSYIYVVEDANQPDFIMVPNGAELRLWVKNGNGADASYVKPNSTSANDLSKRDGYRYITITGDTTLYIYYDYYGHDVSFTYQIVDGDSPGTNEPVGSFRLDAANGWQWVSGGVNELSGRSYTYRVENVVEHLANGTDVTATGYPGFEVPVIGTLTEDPETHKWSMTITNKRKDFTFTKQWRDSMGSGAVDWPEGKSITVDILRTTSPTDPDPGVYATYTITYGDSFVVGTEIPATNDPALPVLKLIRNNHDAYTFRIEDLPAEDTEGGDPVDYIYYVSETNADGSQSAKYIHANGTQALGATKIEDGGTICNDLLIFVLPSTGGPGTGIFYAFGAALVLLAFAMIMRRRSDF